MTADLAKVEPRRDILDVIADAAQNPAVDVQKMKELLAMKREVDAENARKAYMLAMAQLQGKMPRITKEGTVDIGGTKRKYERLEDLHHAIQPLLAEYGFSADFDCKADGELYVYTCKLSHAAGHFETKSLPMPIDHVTARDGRSVRSAAQDVGATTSYARRQLLKMMLNIVARGEDTDGAPVVRITEKDAAEIRADLKEVGRTEEQLCKVLGVTKLEDAVPAHVPTVKYFMTTSRKQKSA